MGSPGLGTSCSAPKNRQRRVGPPPHPLSFRMRDAQMFGLALALRLFQTLGLGGGQSIGGRGGSETWHVALLPVPAAVG